MKTLDTTAYWLESAPFPRFPKIDQDVTVDVAIVGGGIMGVTAAHLLKQAGLTVALIDRDVVAGVDTMCTTAHLTCVTDQRLHQRRKHFNDDVAKAVWDAGGAGLDQIVRLIREEDIRCDFQWATGFLHAPVGEPRAESAVDDLKQEASAADVLGINAWFQERTAPWEVPGVVFPKQAIFHPRKYLAPLARSLPGKGSHVFSHTPADEISARMIKSGERKIHFQHLILATHTPLTGNTSLLPALLFQTKLYLYTSYAVSARVKPGTVPPGAYWDTSDPYFYLRVEPGREFDRLIFGGEDHKTGQVDDTRNHYHALEQRLERYAPGAKIDHRWSGQVIETNDGLPFIGETAEHQFAGTGFSGNGMTFGSLAALMAADSVLKRKNPWTDIFDIHRKHVLGGTWRYLAENADYPYYMVRNWLGGTDGDSLASVKPGQGKILKLDGKKVAAHRDADGKVSLCSPVCTHLQCIVDWNQSEQTWDCPCHGSRFKPSGEVISGPAEEPLKKIQH